MSGHSPLLLSLCMVAISAWFFCIAWFKPDLHRKYLRLVSRLYSRWDPTSAQWTNSETNFWLTRIAATLIFLLSLTVFLAVA